MALRISSRRRRSAGFIWPGSSGVICLLVYEHSLVRPDDLSRVNRAFFQVNGVISIGLLLLVLLQIALGR